MNATHGLHAARASLEKRTAAELMTPNPLSIRESASVAEAIRFLTNKGFSAAPVIDAGGRPIGVLSRADILVFDRENAGAFYDSTESPAEAELPMPERGEDTRVAEVMTPVVFSVRPQTPAIEIAEEMVRLRVHRMFVVDDAGVLVGVVSSLDMLRELVD